VNSKRLQKGLVEESSERILHLFRDQPANGEINEKGEKGKEGKEKEKERNIHAK